eukprot:362183-Chlamydomonas_euryale.AAC.6
MRPAAVTASAAELRSLARGRRAARPPAAIETPLAAPCRLSRRARPSETNAAVAAAAAADRARPMLVRAKCDTTGFAPRGQATTTSRRLLQVARVCHPAVRRRGAREARIHGAPASTRPGWLSGAGVPPCARSLRVGAATAAAAAPRVWDSRPGSAAALRSRSANLPLCVPRCTAASKLARCCQPRRLEHGRAAGCDAGALSVRRRCKSVGRAHTHLATAAPESARPPLAGQPRRPEPQSTRLEMRTSDTLQKAFATGRAREAQHGDVKKREPLPCRICDLSKGLRIDRPKKIATAADTGLVPNCVSPAIRFDSAGRLVHPNAEMVRGIFGSNWVRGRRDAPERFSAICVPETGPLTPRPATAASTPRSRYCRRDSPPSPS